MASTLARRNSSINKIREYSLPKVNLDDEYEVLHVVQEGWRGRLLLVEHRRTRHEVVLKAVHSESTSKPDFFREFHYNYYLSPHTNILNAYDVAFQAGEHYLFAQEYAPFGDLTSNLVETGLGEVAVKKVAPQLVSALEFMHSKDLVHGNVNMDNVLVFNIDFSEVKLCDFGSTRKNGFIIKRKIVMLPFAAPEVVDTVHNENFQVTTKQDVWQLGILIFILLTGALPWQKADLSDPHYVEYLNWRKRKMLKTPKRFSNFTTRALRLFKRLLEPKAEKRSPVREVCKYLEDKWLVRPMKRREDVDNQSICYSTFSVHSSKIEKDRVLHALKAHGIETTVDRVAKKKRINEWIEKSLTSNHMFDINENEHSITEEKENIETQHQQITQSPQNVTKSRVSKSNVIDNSYKLSMQRAKSIYQGLNDQKSNSNILVSSPNQNVARNLHEKNQHLTYVDNKQSVQTNNINVSKHRNVNENLVLKTNIRETFFCPKNPQSHLLSSNVKRAYSFQDKTQQQQQNSPTETPCNNYKEIHSQFDYSPTRIGNLNSRGRSKSQKIYSKTKDSHTLEVSHSPLVETQQRSRPKPRRNPREMKESLQRSKSLARTHEDTSRSPRSQETNSRGASFANKIKQSGRKTSLSNDSLSTVVLPAHYSHNYNI